MNQDKIGVIGIPYDEKSSFLRGPAQAPYQIWQTLHDTSSNMLSELGVVLEEGENYKYEGVITVNNYPTDITKGIEHVFDKYDRIITLGGDHSITYPIMKAYHKKYPDLHILQFDAHTDLHDEFEGDRYSHACPFARIMENKYAQSLTQIGIRLTTGHPEEQARKFGVNVVSMKDWYDGVRPEIKGPLYISLDLDVLDPGFAPGISHHEPGGMSPREVISFIQNIDVPIIGADIVEYNPVRDHQNMTAQVAAKFFKEILGKMME